MTPRAIPCPPAVTGLFRYLGGLVYLLADGLWWITVGPLSGRGRFRFSEVSYQSMRISVRSFGITSLVIFFVGMILAFQMAYVLKALGVVEYVANIIGVAMVREMGPLLVGMVMTGFTGAAIAAEIGTMVVSEEVLALETAALHPVNFLVAPRLLAAKAASSRSVKTRRLDNVVRASVSASSEMVLFASLRLSV